MPFERQEPTGKLISERANWTDEEVTAVLDYHTVLEEEEYEKQTELVRTEGYAVLGHPHDIWNHVTEGSTEGYIY